MDGYDRNIVMKRTEEAAKKDEKRLRNCKILSPH